MPNFANLIAKQNDGNVFSPTRGGSRNIFVATTFQEVAVGNVSARKKNDKCASGARKTILLFFLPQLTRSVRQVVL